MKSSRAEFAHLSDSKNKVGGEGLGRAGESQEDSHVYDDRPGKVMLWGRANLQVMPIISYIIIFSYGVSHVKLSVWGLAKPW